MIDSTDFDFTLAGVYIPLEANDNSPASKMALYIADMDRRLSEREKAVDKAIEACRETIKALDEYAAKVGEFV